MSDKTAVLLESSPTASLRLFDCYQAACQLDSIELIFLRSDAVMLANPQLAPPADEPNLARLWGDLARKHQCPIIACSTSCQRRGIAAPAAGYQIAGLAQWFSRLDDMTSLVQG